MVQLEDEPYVNEHHERVVERLHRRSKITAVVANANSNITVYLTRQGLLESDQLWPYEIKRVDPLPDCSEFGCKATLTADWAEIGDEREQ